MSRQLTIYAGTEKEAADARSELINLIDWIEESCVFLKFKVSHLNEDAKLVNPMVSEVQISEEKWLSIQLRLGNME